MTTRIGKIQTALVERLKTITTANGYESNIEKVYSDEIPMGLSLEEFELPALLVIAGEMGFKHQNKCLFVVSDFEIQIIAHPAKPDSYLWQIMKDISLAIYNDGPVGNRSDAWRTFDGKPTAVWLKHNLTDLNMIAGNRMYCFTIVIEYHAATPTDL